MSLAPRRRGERAGFFLDQALSAYGRPSKYFPNSALTAAPSQRLVVRGGPVAFASFTLRCQRTLFVICSEHSVVERLRRMTRARPLLDPFAQGRIPSAPCTLAPLHSVSPYQDWRCKQLCRSCLAGVRPDHPRSCDRQFLPTPFRQLGALSRWGALLRSLATELVWR